MSKLNRMSLITFLFGGSFYWFSFHYLDQSLAKFLHQYSYEPLVSLFYHIATFLGESYLSLGFTALSLVFSIAILCRHPQNRLANNLLSMSLAMLAAIFFAYVLKFLLGRYRPEMLFQEGLYGFHYLSHQFQLNSTPSGHATRAFVFVTGFSLMWRRLTPVFILLGLCVCFSRLALECHYLSDVVFGALLGTFTTLWVTKLYHSMTLSHTMYAPLKFR